MAAGEASRAEIAMTRRNLRCVYMYVSCATAWLLVGLGAPGLADDDIARDRRLASPVTIRGARLHVGEVAEELTRQTGVPICADESTGAADARLLVSADNLPAWKVMDALARLFSYKLAPWYWERADEGPTPGYRLVQTRAARGLAATLQDQAQRAFEADVATRIDAAQLSSAEYAARLADPTPMSLKELRPLGARIFAECVPDEVRSSLLHGEQTYELPVAALPGWAQRFVEDTYKTAELYRLLPDGSVQRVPPPRSIRLSADRLGADATRTLWVHLDGIGARDYAGGPRLERPFLANLQELWLGEGDRRSNSAVEAIALCDPEPAARQRQRLPFLHRALLEVSERSGVPIMARLPDDRTSLPGGLAVDRGATVGQYLAALDRSYPALAKKWRSGVLLVSYHSWFVRDEDVHRPPWRIVKRVREAARRNDGMVPLAELVAAATDMSPQQLQALASDWPAASGLLAIRDVLEGVRRDASALRSLTTTGRTALLGAAARRSAVGHMRGSPLLDRVDRVVLTARGSGSGATRGMDMEVVVSERTGAELTRIAFRLGADTP